jgi:hypothetical protein
MISDKNKLSATTVQRHQHGWLGRLSRLVDQDTIKVHAVDNIAS